MTRRKNEQDVKEEVSTLENELVWMCPWMDCKYATRCGILLKSCEVSAMLMGRESISRHYPQKLRERVHKHI
jgi:hypothetical protein